jgi:ABC-type multidrug transport system fused ATPase/permease subunit
MRTRPVTNPPGRPPAPKLRGRGADPLLIDLLRPVRGRIVQSLAWAGLLALAAAAYGALVGPLLRALFGGPALVWPSLLAPLLPAPPTVESLRFYLPFLLIGTALLKGLASFGHASTTAALGQAVVQDLRSRLHHRLLHLPPDVLAALGAADVQQRITQEVRAVETMAVEGLAIRLRDGLQVVALLTLCLAIEWRLALVVLGTYPLIFWPAARLGRALRRAAGGLHADRSRLAVVLDDQVRRLPMLQMSGGLETAAAGFRQSAHALARAELRAVRLRALGGPLNEAVGALALAGTLIYAGHRIEAGTLAPEHVLSFFVTILLLYQPVKGLLRAQALIEPGRVALARARELLDLAAHLPMGPGHPPPEAPPTLTLRDVAAGRLEHPVLFNVSAHIPAGGLTALVGPNGAGKTTLAWLLARLVEPTAGHIEVDGVPLATLDADGWRRSVGWVAQTPLLGRGTLLDHLGTPLAPEALARLAERTGLTALLARLPNGWHTPLGDGGAGLSGGEQQRLALARALARAPRVLVLDEPTAHLDAEATADFARTIEGLRGQCTLLLITHDARLAAAADTCIRLEAGRVVS